MGNHQIPSFDDLYPDVARYWEPDETAIFRDLFETLSRVGLTFSVAAANSETGGPSVSFRNGQNVDVVNISRSASRGERDYVFYADMPTYPAISDDLDRLAVVGLAFFIVSEMVARVHETGRTPSDAGAEQAE